MTTKINRFALVLSLIQCVVFIANAAPSSPTKKPTVVPTLVPTSAPTVDYSCVHATSWLVNTDGQYSHIFSSTSDIKTSGFVNVTTATTGWKATFTGIPFYGHTFTTSEITSLNSRPDASSDFTTGQTTAVAGTYYEFGADIGYESTKCTVGYWPSGPGCPEAQNGTYTFPVFPSPETGDCYVTAHIGYFVNGVPFWSWSDTTSYNSEGVWYGLAMKFEQYDMDICVGHSASGVYHHHSVSPCLMTQLNDTGHRHSPVHGFAPDGYPIYGPYQAAKTLAVSCWQARDYSSSSVTGCSDGQRSCTLVDAYDYTKGTTTAASNGPDPSGTVDTQSGQTISAASGCYFQDFYFNDTCADLGSQYLDTHNGHSHGSYGYHYHATMDSDSVPTFPYTMGPKYYGCLPNDGNCQTAFYSGITKSKCTTDPTQRAGSCTKYEYSPAISYPTMAPTLSFSPTAPTISPTANPTRPTVRPSKAPSAKPTTIAPSMVPTTSTTASPSIAPTLRPSASPSIAPTLLPTTAPTLGPSQPPTLCPTVRPSTSPTLAPTVTPTLSPSLIPTLSPTVIPTLNPTVIPTVIPTLSPTITPTLTPTLTPSRAPSVTPTVEPSLKPSMSPSIGPSQSPSVPPTLTPTVNPSTTPTCVPTQSPTTAAPSVSYPPSIAPSVGPTVLPTIEPTQSPTILPTISSPPSESPTVAPTDTPTIKPTRSPTVKPSQRPSRLPTTEPSVKPSREPTARPTVAPTEAPTTTQPTVEPTDSPSEVPTIEPSAVPTQPTVSPSIAPSQLPTVVPTQRPTTVNPTPAPSVKPSRLPSVVPSARPSPGPGEPTYHPTLSPSLVPSQSPSFQSAPILSFTTSTTLSGLTSDTLDEAAQDAFVNATATALGVSSSYVTYSGSTVETTRKLLRTVLSTFTITATTDVVIPLIDFTVNATVLYTVIKSSFDEAVANGNFTKYLTAASVVHESDSTLVTTVQSYVIGDSAVVNVPTFQPSRSPEGSSDSALLSGTSLYLTIGLAGGGGCLLLVVSIVLFVWCCQKKAGPDSAGAGDAGQSTTTSPHPVGAPHSASAASSAEPKRKKKKSKAASRGASPAMSGDEGESSGEKKHKKKRASSSAGKGKVTTYKSGSVSELGI